MKILFRFLCYCFISTLFLTFSVGSSVVCAQTNAQKLSLQKKQIQKEQDTLESRIKKLEYSLSKSKNKSLLTSKELKQANQKIASINLRLKTLEQQKQALEKELKIFKGKEQEVHQSIFSLNQDIAENSKAQYLNSRHVLWQRFIDGDNLNTPSRERALLQYLRKEQNRSINLLAKEEQKIHFLSRQATQKNLSLDRVLNKQENNRKLLLSQKQEKSKTLERLSQSISTQKQTINKLKQNQARLQNLVSMIDKKIKAEAKKRQALAKKRGFKASPTIAKPMTTSTKGLLRRPVNAPLLAKFGQKRPEGTKWQGLFFTAPIGTPVRACKAGVVVFAEWLRGFGNLIIIDHGNQYMSVYANNNAILCAQGDSIKQGKIIAKVGKTGNEKEPGLYFELRHHGKAINPIPWLKK